MRRARRVNRWGWSALALMLVGGAIGASLSNTARDYLRLLTGFNVYTPEAQAAETPPSRQVPVMDGTLFKEKPPLAREGFPPIKIIYESELWSPGADTQQLPTPFRLKTIVGRWKREPMLVIDDMEHWPFFDPDQRLNRANLDKYLQLIAQAKAAAPGAKIGFYGTPPLSDYWRAIDNNPRQRRVDWQRDNDAIQALADAQDVLYPSLYTFYADQQGWVAYAQAQIAEARRMAKGKPVFVFLWPQYHNSNKLLGCQFVGAAYWRLQLETARQLADGVIVWGGWDVCSKPGGQQSWDDEAEWWAITRTFLPAGAVASPPSQPTP